MQGGGLYAPPLETHPAGLALPENPGETAPPFFAKRLKVFPGVKSHEVKQFGADPKWKDYLNVFKTRQTDILKTFGLPIEVFESPDLITDEWPTPGVMLWGKKKQKLPPFVSGSRHAVLKEIYDTHYAFQSAQAHGRMAAVSMAFLVDQPEYQWNPKSGPSNIVVTALLCLACILSEIEIAGGYPHHPKLAELWAYLREFDEEVKDVWALRYEALMK